MITNVIAYSATSISILGRFIFMYLLYSRKSTNVYSLVFSILNIISSSLWINYSMMTGDTPLLVRGTADFILFTISSGYIIINRIHMPVEDAMVSRTVTIMVQPQRDG